MSKRILFPLSSALLVMAFAISVFGQSSSSNVLLRARSLRGNLSLRFLNGSSEREQDGLNGPVRRVRTETAKLSNKNGKLVEAQRVPLEVAAYDIKGAKIENAYYPVPGAAVTGKEVYKYDDKGNIVEMTLQDEKGTLLSKETYTYEFDQFGNWTKMTTSVAVIENGKITFEPTEVTYRTISYYLDEATLAKMNQPQAPASTSATNATNTVASNTPANNNVPASGNALTSNPAKAQAPSSAPSKPVAQTSTPANNAANDSKQPLQALTGNKPATSEQPKQSSPQPTSAPASNSSAPVVKTSAPVSDKPAASSNEQAKTSGTNETASKPADEQANSKPVVKPLLRPVSGGVLNGKAVSLPKPVYPLTAKSARLSGLVVVEVVVDINGKVISAKAVSGPALLQQAAVQAAYQAKFTPTMLSDQPVKVVGTINYNFSLGQ